MDRFKEVDELMQYIADDLLKDHKEKDIIIEGIKMYAEAYHKVKLNLNLVTGSIGENTKGTLTEMTASEFEENGDPCRLCIFNTVYGASKMCHKCLKENKQTQYYL